jgi:hypothetical protein
MEGGKVIMGLKTIVNQQTFDFVIRKNASFTLSSLWLSYMDVKFGVVVSLENTRERYNKSKIILSLIISKLRAIHRILSSS